MQERAMMWQANAHNVAEFEYRELAGQIFNEQFWHENATEYYILYTVRFTLTRRTQ
jgi:hypothetical protein